MLRSILLVTSFCLPGVNGFVAPTSLSLHRPTVGSLFSAPTIPEEKQIILEDADADGYIVDADGYIVDANSAEAIRSERFALDISKTVYVSSIKAPKDAYKAFAEKGAANAKMSKHKIFHQSVLGGMYVGFAGLLSLTVAGNMGGIGVTNPGLIKMTFAALFPVNLLIIVTTSGQLFTGNTATVGAAKLEKLVEWRELVKSWFVSLAGNIVGCGGFALAAWYTGLLTGGTAALACQTAVGKVSAGFGPTLVKAIMCNWMVSIAVFLAGASNDLTGKLVAVWFPISAFVAIGLEHSVANLFIMPCALLSGVGISLKTMIVRNLIPAIIGNAIAGMGIVAGSYSYQFGLLGKEKRKAFREKQKAYEARMASARAAKTSVSFISLGES